MTLVFFLARSNLCFSLARLVLDLPSDGPARRAHIASVKRKSGLAVHVILTLQLQCRHDARWLRGCARSAAGGAVLVALRGRALCGSPRGGVSVCAVRAGSRVGVAVRPGARLRAAPAHPPRSVAADRDSGRRPGRPRGSPWLQRRVRPRSRGASGVAPLTAGTQQLT